MLVEIQIHFTAKNDLLVELQIHFTAKNDLLVEIQIHFTAKMICWLKSKSTSLLK